MQNLFTNRMKILFWHRKQKINGRGEAPIYCRITLNGDRSEFSTNIFCPVSNFNASKQIIVSKYDVEPQNIQLEKVKHKIQMLFIELDNKGIFITSNLLRDYFLGKKTLNISLVQLMEEYKEHRLKLTRIGEIKATTLSKCKDTLKNLNSFLIDSNQRQIDLLQVSPKIANDFYYWLQSHKKTGAEYAAKSIQIIKAMLNYAVLNDYLKHNPLLSIQFKRGARKKIEFLQPKEVEDLKNRKFVADRLQKVADLFLIQCFTGFSYSDLANFDINKHIEIENSKEWIVKPRSKNGYEAVLPFFDNAKAIVEKYITYNMLGEKVLNLPVITNTKYNSYLKEIGEILGFKIILTTHIGRKTFGTIALNDGYTIEAVSRMLGHTNIKTTQAHYAVVLRKRIEGEMH